MDDDRSGCRDTALYSVIVIPLTVLILPVLTPLQHGLERLVGWRWRRNFPKKRDDGKPKRVYTIGDDGELIEPGSESQPVRQIEISVDDLNAANQNTLDPASDPDRPPAPAWAPAAARIIQKRAHRR
jgi:hypothetical protein